MQTFGKWLLSGAAGFIIAGASALAADNSKSVIETVTVTGQSFEHDVKGQTPLIETPQNIQIISSELLDAQGVTRLDEALRNVAGVMGGGYYSTYDYFRIRGFDASGYIYLDGMRLDSYVDVNAEMFGLEQIQVVKGPASAMYGQGALGGLVNFVSKRPTDKSFLNVGASFGSYGSYEVNMDGNLLVSGDVATRLVALKRHEGSFVDGSDGNDRTYIAPSVTWNIDDQTTLTLLGSYQHDKMNIAMPLTALGTITPSAYGTYSPKTFTAPLGDTNRSETNRTMMGYQFSHSFNSVFSLNHRLRYTINDQDWDNIYYTSSLSADGRYLSLYPYDYNSYGSMLSTDTSVSAVFETGPLKHQVLVGTDYYISHSHSHSRQIDYSDADSYYILDLYNQVRGLATPEYASFASTKEASHDLGAYVQDHITYGKWSLTGSLRWDGAQSGTSTQQKDVAFTPRLGVTYAVMPQNVLFASYSESFLPQSGTKYTGELLKPERGRQWETGIKSSLLDGQIDITASLYYLTRNNVSTSDQVHPNFYTQSGKQRSRGFEFDSRFQMTTNWQAILTYSYTDAVVISDATTPKGDELLNVPKNSVGLWTRYAFDGIVKGLSVAGGVYHYASQAGDLPNTFRIPDYTLVNTQLAYNYGPAEIQVGVKNLFNERYYSGSYSSTYLQPGFPRSFNVDLKVAL